LIFMTIPNSNIPDRAAISRHQSLQRNNERKKEI
jgi:hypothetical protein